MAATEKQGRHTIRMGQASILFYEHARRCYRANPERAKAATRLRRIAIFRFTNMSLPRRRFYLPRLGKWTLGRTGRQPTNLSFYYRRVKATNANRCLTELAELLHSFRVEDHNVNDDSKIGAVPTENRLTYTIHCVLPTSGLDSRGIARAETSAR